MRDYKVAVVIPTLNEEKFIASCLDSVIAQSYSFADMDVMVVDGGSKDKTREIVSEYQRKYTNVRLIDNPGRIQSVAFNIGVRESDAPYVVRLDAHATYDEDYIRNCLKIYSADAETLGCAPELLGNVGGVWHIRPRHSGIIPEASAILNRSKFGIGGAAFRVGAPAGFVDTVPFGCFPRSVIERIGWMREDLPRGEDNEYNSRIRKAGYKIYLDPEIVCTYFSRDTMKANVKQMYANGKSIGHLVYIDRDAVGLRHLVPVLFVTGLAAGLVVSLLWQPFVRIYLAGITLYLSCALVAAIKACKSESYKYLLPLLLLFPGIHIAYGLGTIDGLVGGLKTQKQ